MSSENSPSKPPLSNRPQPKWGVIESVLTLVVGHAAAIFVTIVIVIFISAVLAITGSELDLRNDILTNFGLLVISNLVILAVIVGYARLKGNRLSDLGLRPAKLSGYLWVIPATLAYVFLVTVVFAVLPFIFPQLDLNQNQDIPFIDARGTFEMIVAFIALIIVAPVAEEIIYRGWLFGGLKKRLGVPLAMVLSSIGFALVHGQINVMIDTFVLGLILAWLYYYTKSIWPAVVLHALKNSIAFYVLFFTDLA